MGEALRRHACQRRLALSAAAMNGHDAGTGVAGEPGAQADLFVDAPLKGVQHLRQRSNDAAQGVLLRIAYIRLTWRRCVAGSRVGERGIEHDVAGRPGTSALGHREPRLPQRLLHRHAARQVAVECP